MRTSFGWEGKGRYGSFNLFPEGWKTELALGGWLVTSFRLPTVGSRAFPIAGAKVWNSLPDDVTSAPFLSTYRRHLKTYLFRCCYNTV